MRVLEQYADKDFKIYMRMSMAQFNTLVDLTKDHLNFAQSVVRPQEHVREQPKLCLYRLGAKALSMDRALLLEVYLCHLRPRSKVHSMADKARRWVIKAWFMDLYGLPQAIGSVDGVHLPYDSVPCLDPDAWNTYKCRYAVGATAVCDHELCFTFFTAGHVGSNHDSAAFKRSELYLRSNILFNGDEYLLGDNGYSLLPIFMTPFKANEGMTSIRKNYNRQHKYDRA